MLADVLRLIRVPLLFTALADPVAGYCLGMPAGASPRWEAILPTLLASVCLYAAGMVFNDCADLIRDRTLHPDRPLASGRIAFAPAFSLGVVLGLVAILAAQTVNARTGATAFGLALGILFYNGVAKRSWIPGSLVMGALRTGNVLMGLYAAAPPTLASAGTAAAFLGVIFLYVTLLTLLSGLEEPPPRPKTFITLVVLMALAAVSTVLVLPAPFAGGLWISLALVLLLALALLARGLNALREFDPGQVSTLVQIGVLGIIPLDAAVAVGTGNLMISMALLLLLIPPLGLVTGFIRMPGLERAN